MTTTLRILGVPAPQGSKTRMPNGAMVEAASATGRRTRQVHGRRPTLVERTPVRREVAA